MTRVVEQMTTAAEMYHLSSPPLVAFNVNDHVRVRLTNHGRNILRSEHYHTPDEDEFGTSRWQLWQLMAAFGAHLYNGCKIPFEMGIEFEVRE